MCYPGWIPIPTTLTGLVFINVNEYRVDEYLNWLQKCSCLLMPCVLGMLLIHSMHTGPIHQFWPIIQLFVYSLLVPIKRKVIHLNSPASGLKFEILGVWYAYWFDLYLFLKKNSRLSFKKEKKNREKIEDFFLICHKKKEKKGNRREPKGE